MVLPLRGTWLLRLVLWKASCMATLAGEEGPTVTTTEKRDPDGVELLARFDFGAAVKDYRGFFRAAAATA
jgi:hypothetical protein